MIDDSDMDSMKMLLINVEYQTQVMAIHSMINTTENLIVLEHVTIGSN